MKNFIFTIFICFLIHSGFSQTIPSWMPTDDLMLWWPLNGNAGDSSGNGLHGSVMDATLTTDRNGNPNSAYYFSSVSCRPHIFINNLPFKNTQKGLTVSYWVYRSGRGCLNPRLWGFWGGSNNTSAWGIEWFNGANHNGLKTRLSDKTWYHITVVSNADSFKMYLNGTLDNVRARKQTYPTPKYFSLGRMTHPSYDAFNGKFDDLAIWGRELNASEVEKLFKKKGPCADSFAFNSDTLDFEGCSRDSLKIVASGNWAEYTWSNGSTDSFIYASESGEYRVNLKDSVGCEISDSFYFVNPGVVSVDVLSVDSVTCYGLGDGSVTTESSGGFQPYTYSWNDPLNQSAPNAENLSDGTYQLIVSDKYGCSDSISVEVYEPDELVNFASTIRNIKCHNDSNGMISVEMRGGTKPYTFIWNNNRTTSTEIKNLAAGDYELIVEDKNGCKDTSNFTLSNPDKLEVEIIEPIHTMKNMPVRLNVRVVPVGDDYTYKWEPADVFKQESAKENPVIVLKETQGLKVNVSTNSGCVGMDSIEMRVLQSLDEILPNAITPDGDGINDIFKPQKYFDILEFKIYNKWGQLIYDNQGSQEGWDGTFAGDVVPAGVYYYILQVQVKYTDQLIQHSGDITVIK